MMRVEHSFKNLIYGVINQTLSSILSFITRYTLIHTLGLLVVSLNGLFTEVIAMLSLAEMGVGSAIVYNLYRPLREQDETKLAQLMNLFQTAYRLIALLVFVIGMLLLPFVHLLVTKVELELWYLRLVYFLFLVQTASSYLFSYKACLIIADQKGYVVSACSMAVRLTSTLISILILILTRQYLLYLLLQITATLANNLLISYQVDRRYPLLNRADRLPAEERKQVLSNVKYLFIGVLSGKIANSTDNILISTMVSTLSVGAYSCYSSIINAAKSLLVQINSASSGSVGDMVSEGDHKRTELVIRRLTFITFCPSVFAAVEIYTVSTPFIRLIYGKEYLLPMDVVFVCAMNLYLYLVKNPIWSTTGVSGLFAQNKNISLVGDAINLLVSVLLCRRLGIAGILLGTSCMFLTELVLKTRLLFHSFLHLSARPYVCLLLKTTAVCIFCMWAARKVCSCLPVSNLVLQILCYGFCSGGIVLATVLLAFHAAPEFQYMKDIGKKLLIRFFNKKKGRWARYAK